MAHSATLHTSISDYPERKGIDMRATYHFTKADKAIIYKMALDLVARYRNQYAEYERDCETDRANGYRAHYCEHGTSLWTDYDTICGRCEDGLTLAYGPWKYERALAEATARYVRFEELSRTVRLVRLMANDASELATLRKLMSESFDLDAYFGRY